MSAPYILLARPHGFPRYNIDGLDYVVDDFGTLVRSEWDIYCVFLRQATHEVDDDAMRAYWPAEMLPPPPKVARAVAASTARELARIEAKLERWELIHLRELAASQAERIDELERAASDAERSAELWSDMAREAQDALYEAGIGAMGITRSGQAVFLPAAVEWHPA